MKLSKRKYFKTISNEFFAYSEISSVKKELDNDGYIQLIVTTKQGVKIELWGSDVYKFEASIRTD